VIGNNKMIDYCALDCSSSSAYNSVCSFLNCVFCWAWSHDDWCV